MAATMTALRPAAANGVSRTLRIGGHIRYRFGRNGGYKLAAGEYGAEVWDMAPGGRPNPPGPRLQAYGRTLTDAGYAVLVAYNSYLLVALPAEANPAAHAVPKSIRTERTT